MSEKSKETAKPPVVLIDLGGDAGVEDLAERSAGLVNRAMETVQAMAQQVVAAAGEIEHPPSRVEVSFGIKFDETLGALVAKTSAEAGLTVTLTWTKDQKNDNKVSVLGLVPSNS